VRGFVERTLALAEKVGNPRAQSLCHNFLGAVQHLMGDWPAALANLRRGIALDRQYRAASGEALGWQRLGIVETALGEFEPAHAHLRRGLDAAEHATMRAHCLVRLYASLARNRLEAGDEVAAADYLAEGMAAQERHGQCVTCGVLFYPIAAIVCVARGDLASAARFCEQAEQAADDYRSTAWIAMARQARGVLQLAERDPNAAAATFGEAVTLFGRLGQPYDAAVCQSYLAEAMLAQSPSKGSRSASELLLQAHAVLANLGARPALSRVERLLTRAS
jgi:tetratricopeptide (TPR) repeat protein